MPEPNTFEALLHEAQALCDAGRHRQALAPLDRALALEPASALAWFCRGSACSALGEPAEAARCYLQSTQHRPDHPLTWFNLGNALRELGELDKALDCFDLVVRLNPGDVDAWVHKGELLDGRGEHARALACYERALSLRT
jgi:tetratricopeptide (TPR) repeat protein